MAYTADQLANLWIQAGGNPAAAKQAAAVALAESSGNPSAVGKNHNGSVDIGLWQINSSHGALASADPVANARAAVSLSKNGTSFSPWCTAYSDGACGTKGGKYSLTSGSPAARILAQLGIAPPAGGAGSPAGATGTGGATANGAPGGAVGAGGSPLDGVPQSAQGSAAAVQPSWFLKYLTAVEVDAINVANPILNNITYGAFGLLGIVLFTFGLYKVFTSTEFGAGVAGAAKSGIGAVAKTAAVLV